MATHDSNGPRPPTKATDYGHAADYADTSVPLLPSSFDIGATQVEALVQAETACGKLLEYARAALEANNPPNVVELLQDSPLTAAPKL